ncbi:hypothetical protein LZ32DRAFT_79233 [Colletotrichum eremochloae]|nr:hypothetical protein LZ32DRAFT_79233 [Colletotrichum eremochloae]
MAHSRYRLMLLDSHITIDFCLDRLMHTRVGRNRGKTLRQASKRKDAEATQAYASFDTSAPKTLRFFPSNHICQLDVSIRAPFIRRLRLSAHPPSHPFHACLGPPSWARRSGGKTKNLPTHSSEVSTLKAGVISFSGHGNVEVDRDEGKKKEEEEKFSNLPSPHFLPTPSSLSSC